MARQPHRIQPFEPFASGRQQKTKPSQIVTDDRRSWFKTVPGLVFSNEVLIPAAGVSATYNRAVTTEAINLRLPRPEPVTLSFHPWWSDDQDRFRLMPHLFAEVEPDTDASLQARWGRIFVEWGTGQSRAWTYLDAGPGSLQLPSVSEVRVSGWTRTTPFILSVNAQIGYASADLTATWTFHLRNNVVSSFARSIPNFARQITGYGGWTNGNWALNDLGRISLLDNSGRNIMDWSVRSPAAPNPSQRPYPCSQVPISGSVRLLELALITTTGGTFNVTGTATVKI